VVLPVVGPGLLAEPGLRFVGTAGMAANAAVLHAKKKTRKSSVSAFVVPAGPGTGIPSKKEANGSIESRKPQRGSSDIRIILIIYPPDLSQQVRRYPLCFC
jgi:hypothetical protein